MVQPRGARLLHVILHAPLVAPGRRVAEQPRAAQADHRPLTADGARRGGALRLEIGPRLAAGRLPRGLRHRLRAAGGQQHQHCQQQGRYTLFHPIPSLQEFHVFQAQALP